MKKLFVLSLITAMVILVGCSTSSDSGANGSPNSAENVKIMKLGSVNAKDRSLTKGMEKFGEIVERETGGAIKVQVYPDGQLGGDQQTFEGLQMGAIQGTTISTGPIATYVKSFSLFDLPFLFKDEQTAYEILDGPIGQELLDELPSVGVIGLGYWENGYRHLTNNKKEIKTVEDIKGLKIRTLENEVHLELWKTLGTTPTPMAFTELFTALEQRVVDGQENPSGVVKSAKLYEVQKYLTKTGHIYNASPFLISKKFWDTLSDEEKEIMKKAAEEAKIYQRELNQKESEESLEYLAQNGMTITELTPEERQKFQETVQPVYEKYAPVIGEDLVKKLLEAIK